MKIVWIESTLLYSVVPLSPAFHNSALVGCCSPVLPLRYGVVVWIVLDDSTGMNTLVDRKYNTVVWIGAKGSAAAAF